MHIILGFTTTAEEEICEGIYMGDDMPQKYGNGESENIKQDRNGILIAYNSL